MGFQPMIIGKMPMPRELAFSPLQRVLQANFAWSSFRASLGMTLLARTMAAD